MAGGMQLLVDFESLVRSVARGGGEVHGGALMALAEEYGRVRVAPTPTGEWRTRLRTRSGSRGPAPSRSTCRPCAAGVGQQRGRRTERGGRGGPRVVHHAVILELDVPSYRAEAARKRLGTNQERGD